jgi:hypothetical protein
MYIPLSILTGKCDDLTTGVLTLLSLCANDLLRPFFILRLSCRVYLATFKIVLIEGGFLKHDECESTSLRHF